MQVYQNKPQQPRQPYNECDLTFNDIIQTQDKSSPLDSNNILKYHYP